MFQLKCFTESFYINTMLKQNKIAILSKFSLRNSNKVQQNMGKN